MNSITFLGTGGGRFVILSQRRYSGGIWLDIGQRIILDPGPGSLIRALQYGKRCDKLDAVFVSHKHLDHYNDAEIMMEAMTAGMKKKHGTLVISGPALEYISEYHRSMADIITPKNNEKFKINELEIQAIPTYNHFEGIGFKFFTSDGIITYTSDTGFHEDLIGNYKNSKILILNVIFPTGKSSDAHLNTMDAIRIVKEAKPEIAIIQHFGMRMLNSNPYLEAKKIEMESGVKTIAARDGMAIDIEKLTSAESDNMIFFGNHSSDFSEEKSDKQIKLM